MKIPPLYTSGAVTPGCEWVVAGEGYATCKLASVTLRVLGHRPMLFDAEANEWRRVTKADAAACDAWRRVNPEHILDGHYHLLGPSIKGNPHGYDSHRIAPRRRLHTIKPDQEFLRDVFRQSEALGFVWHHPETGKMAQVERGDLAG